MLLHSCPDTVHRFLLRKTQTSTPLIEGSSTGYKPRIGITPAVADCRYRAPLSPRLHGNFMTCVGLYANFPYIYIINAHVYIFSCIANLVYMESGYLSRSRLFLFLFFYGCFLFPESLKKILHKPRTLFL